MDDLFRDDGGSMTASSPRKIVDVSGYKSSFSVGHRLRRLIWGGVWLLLFRPSPIPFHRWRGFLLRLFGASIGRNCSIYPTATIWAPWNLEMSDHSCLSHHAVCYSVDRVVIGPHATVSQYSYLCTASHDITDPHMRLITGPIVLEAGAWVTTDVFVGPGVTIGEGAVVGARAAVFKDVEPWTVVGGNPAQFIRKRELQ